METKKRKSVPVRANAACLAERIQHPETPERRAVSGLVGGLPEGELSESTALAALLEAGRTAVAQEVLAQEYAAMAQEDTREDREARAAMRGRVSRRQQAD
ncbi:molecular chaperone GrpE [Nocardiopsis synnemataformans]|uniref:molecular chaperone GrpE n=1 Tax=Nocardiopsis synnemataformans TaxID=61305 RepID=UPI003EB8A4EF